MKKITLLFLLLLFTASNAFAKNGIYFTLDSGWANQSKLTQYDTTIDRNNFPVYRASVGYIHDFYFAPWLGMGLEIGLGDYSKADFYNQNHDHLVIHSSATEFLAILISHFRQFDFLIKAGGVRQPVTIDFNDINEQKTFIQAELGAGINYNFTQHFAVSLTYAHTYNNNNLYFANPAINVSGVNIPNIEEILAGIRVTF